MVQGSARLRRIAQSLRLRWNHRPPRPVSMLLLPAFSVVFLAAQSATRPFARESRTPAIAAGNPPSFEVATVRPSRPGRWGDDIDESGDRLTIRGFTVRRLIREAYGLKSDAQILGGPAWLSDQRFDIVAKVDDAEVARMAKMTDEQSGKEWALMLQSLLADRFQLKAERDERALPVFALVVAHSGPKIRRTNGANGQGNDTGIDIDWEELTARAASMDELADSLTSLRDLSSRVVLNRTGLRGNFDFQLHWTRDRGDGDSDSPYPEIFTALDEQLGLKLKSERATVAVVVVESAQEPAPN